MAMQARTLRTAPATLDEWLLTLSERAHRQAVLAGVPAMAEELQQLLGQRIAAYMVGVEDPKAVGRWSRGERMPRGDAEQRLRAVYQILRIIAIADSEETARAWFIGMNPHLADRAPFAILGEDSNQASRVLAAAKAFVTGD